MKTVLDKKVALVTGAGAGIGLAVARRLAEMGAVVLAGDLNEAGARAAAEALPKPAGQRHLALSLDVTRPESIAAAMELVGKNYGALDILMNNAGVSTMNRLEDLTDEEWDFNFNVNAKGVFLVTRAAIPLMKAKGGRIINTASMAAVKAAPLLAHYTASKFAVLGFTKSAAIELAPYGITVNCVCPGFVKTSMQDREVIWEGRLRGLTPEAVSAEYIAHTPLGRLCLPEDVADVVGFLASPQAGFMTGEAVNIAGGANIV